MAYEGYVDFVDDTTISGWVYDDAFPDDPLSVEVLAGGRVLATVAADRPRPDLVANGKGNGRHAFHHQFDVPPTADEPLQARVPGKRWRLPPGNGPVPVPRRFQPQLAHSLEFGFPDGLSGFTMSTRSADEAAIVGRLVDAYHRAVADAPPAAGGGADVWSNLAAQYHREIVALLDRRDVAAVADYLRDAHATGLTHGITQGDLTTRTLRRQADARQLEHARVVDFLVSLAESLGVLDVESPELAGRWAENLHEDPDALVERVGHAAGVGVVPPAVIGSLFGLRTTAGILSGRDVMALYAALRIKAVAGHWGLDRPAVCEIGGGLGGTAYYVTQLRAAGRYTLIDLPLVNLLQGYYLLRALPGVPIRLYGESAPRDPAIDVLPTFCFGDPDRAGSIDLLFNMDSMPEMHPDYAAGYLRAARARGVPLILSVNQEARAPHSHAARQTAVRDLVADAGGYVRQYRFRHWVRAGYVEELYTLSG